VAGDNVKRLLCLEIISKYIVAVGFANAYNRKSFDAFYASKLNIIHITAGFPKILCSERIN
jgi:hypothetical protein